MAGSGVGQGLVLLAGADAQLAPGSLGAQCLAGQGWQVVVGQDAMIVWTIGVS